jgi:L-arabinokinase
MSSVFFYISGHGFGHASRQIEVVNALGSSDPARPIVVRTSAPRWLFDRSVRVPFTFLEGEVDTGVVQIDSLRLDERATMARADAFHARLPERARTEAELLREHVARLVVADAPALGCAAAAAAGIPSVVCSNFTWDWIYAGYDANADVVRRIGEAYAKTQAAWRLPMHGGFETFANIVDVPFIARHARHSRDEVRRRLGLPLDVPLALVSFGGYGVRDFELSALDCLDDVGVVVTSGAAETPAAPPGVSFVDVTGLYEMGLRYEDLVAAVDVVVTKPGYGIVSECIANETAMLYTSRGRFVEYDVMVEEMPRYLRCRLISQEDLLAGRWRAALRELRSQSAPPEKPPTDGAVRVAELIRAFDGGVS